MVDALSRWPKVKKVYISQIHDLASMHEIYVEDSSFTLILSDLASRKPHDSSKEVLLLGSTLCILKGLCEKVMYELHTSSYTKHHGLYTSTQVENIKFYCPTMRNEDQDHVAKCTIYQKVKFDREKDPRVLQPLPTLMHHDKLAQWSL